MFWELFCEFTNNQLLGESLWLHSKTKFSWQDSTTTYHIYYDTLAKMCYCYIVGFLDDASSLLTLWSMNCSWGKVESNVTSHHLWVRQRYVVLEAFWRHFFFNLIFDTEKTEFQTFVVNEQLFISVYVKSSNVS